MTLVANAQLIDVPSQDGSIIGSVRDLRAVNIAFIEAVIDICTAVSRGFCTSLIPAVEVAS